MNAAFLLLMTSMVSADVSVTTLDGKTVDGALNSLSPEVVSIETADGATELAIDQVLMVDFAKTAEASSTAVERIVTLVDGTQLVLEKVSLDAKTVNLSVAHVGSSTIPVTSVRDLRIQAVDDKLSTSWDEIRNRPIKDDLLVFRKEDVLDYVGGTIRSVTDEKVTILARGRELAAPIERVFGIVYAKRSPVKSRPLVTVKLRSGSNVRAKSLAMKDGSFAMTSLAKWTGTVPEGEIRSLDFGGGRLKWLSDLPFDQTASKAPDPKHEINRFVNANSPAGSGGRLNLKIGDEEFTRGVWLHSGANLRYRLNREYRELRAVVGFEKTHSLRMNQFKPAVEFVVIGDGKELYRQKFNWKSDAEELKLDLTDVRELILRVESRGVHKGILEHFALGDAQVVR